MIYIDTQKKDNIQIFGKPHVILNEFEVITSLITEHLANDSDIEKASEIMLQAFMNGITTKFDYGNKEES